MLGAAALLSRVTTLAHAWHLKRGLTLLYGPIGGAWEDRRFLEQKGRCRIVPPPDSEDDHTDRRARRRLYGLGQRREVMSGNMTVGDGRGSDIRLLTSSDSSCCGCEQGCCDSPCNVSGDKDAPEPRGQPVRRLAETASRLRCLPNIMFIGASKSGSGRVALFLWLRLTSRRPGAPPLPPTTYSFSIIHMFETNISANPYFATCAI